MASIYKITNDVNDKVYIGKTYGSIAKRFKQHCLESSKNHVEARPLYRAMVKYGIDKFHVELVCTSDTPEEDEIKYIEQYDSYRNGYNATLGGDGKKQIDVDINCIIADYIEQENITIKQLCSKYGICEDSLRVILSSNGISIRQANVYRFKTVKQFTKEGVLVAVYKSTNDAGRALGKINGSHISDCICGKRKTAYGFIWTE